MTLEVGQQDSETELSRDKISEDERKKRSRGERQVNARPRLQKLGILVITSEPKRDIRTEIRMPVSTGRGLSTKIVETWET